MKLLKISDAEDCAEEIDQHFENVETEHIERISPQVIDNEPSIRLKENSIDEFEAVYAEIPAKNAIFGRVLLEMIEERGISTNYSSTAFFTMSKKNYLYHVLHEKNIPAPKTAVIADEKASRNLENHLKGPLVARKFEELSEVESTKIDTVEQIGEFTEGIEYGDNFLIFQEYSAGDKYRCLVAGDEVISLLDGSESWDIGKEGLKYSNVSNEIKDIVLDVRKALGTKVAEVLIRDSEVIDVNPNPDLELYANISGKDAFKAVSDALKQEESL